MADPRKRRPRNPAATREAIMDAARTLLARNGPDAISLSEVAELAGVNRGTAYQHFADREQLVTATVARVSDDMFRAVFGDPATVGRRRVETVDITDATDRVIRFAMDNPELCRIWLLQILARPDPADDPFWREYQGSIARFMATSLAREGVDAEALSVLMLAGAFMWPVWARSHARTEDERQGLAHRFAQECLRLSMYGTLQADFFPDVAARLGTAPPPARMRAVGL